MRFPDKGIWDDPGVPSLVVPYGLMSDYYFSGHCGFLMINAAHMWNQDKKKIAIVIGLAIPYVAYTLIMTRIHYTIDIPIGIMYGCYLYIILGPHIKKMDHYTGRVIMAVKRWLCGE
jgi:PAP2 superfamily C-terminal